MDTMTEIKAIELKQLSDEVTNLRISLIGLDDDVSSARYKIEETEAGVEGISKRIGKIQVLMDNINESVEVPDGCELSVKHKGTESTKGTESNKIRFEKILQAMEGLLNLDERELNQSELLVKEMNSLRDTR